MLFVVQGPLLGANSSDFRYFSIGLNRRKLMRWKIKKIHDHGSICRQSVRLQFLNLRLLFKDLSIFQISRFNTGAYGRSYSNRAEFNN